jgi:hypothetical protein
MAVGVGIWGYIVVQIICLLISAAIVTWWTDRQQQADDAAREGEGEITTITSKLARGSFRHFVVAERTESDLEDQLEEEEGEDLSSSALCTICLGEYQCGDRICQVTCGHAFHNSCCEPWMDSRATCPVCRADFNEMVSLQWSLRDEETSHTKSPEKSEDCAPCSGGNIETAGPGEKLAIVPFAPGWQLVEITGASDSCV